MRKSKNKKEEFIDIGDAFAEHFVSSCKGILASVFNKEISISQIAVVFLLFSLTLGIARIGETAAYFNDTESSSGNLFRAAFLDFYLSENEFESFIGKEALGEYSVASAVVVEPGSLGVQYVVNVEKISGDDDFCNGLDLEATKNGIEVHDADMLSLSEATSTVFGTWEFEFDLPPSVTTVGHGDVCEFDIVYTGWRDDTTPEESGFDDEERISFSLTSKMVLMNEMIPNPTGFDGQSGTDGEWVELYNNGDTAIDVAGWQISELATPDTTPTEEFYTIVGTTSPAVGEVRTLSGSTVISAGGWLVILFEAQRLNNTGDTVTLYDGSSNKMDQHTYVNGEAPEGKSIARIPDGIGAWVDPIPTPGFENIEEEITVSVGSTGGSGGAVVNTDTDTLIITTNASTTPEIVIAEEVIATSTPTSSASSPSELTPNQSSAEDVTGQATPEVVEDLGDAPLGDEPVLEGITIESKEEDVTPSELTVLREEDEILDDEEEEEINEDEEIVDEIVIEPIEEETQEVELAEDTEELPVIVVEAPEVVKVPVVVEEEEEIIIEPIVEIEPEIVTEPVEELIEEEVVEIIEI